MNILSIITVYIIGLLFWCAILKFVAEKKDREILFDAALFTIGFWGTQIILHIIKP